MSYHVWFSARTAVHPFETQAEPTGLKPAVQLSTMQPELYDLASTTPQSSQAVLFESGFRPASQLSTTQPEL